MKHFRSIGRGLSVAVVAIVATTLLPVAVVHAREQSPPPAPVAAAATLSVKASRTRFTLGEPACVRVTVRATGKEPLMIPANLREFWGFQVTAPSGQVFYGRAGPVVCYGFEPEASGEDAPANAGIKVLQPGESVVYDTNLLDEVPELFASGGIHEVVLKVESVFIGPSKSVQVLASTPIRIRIVAPVGVDAAAYREMLAWEGGDARRTGGLLTEYRDLTPTLVEQYPGSVYTPYARFALGNEWLRIAQSVRPEPEPGKLRDSTAKHLRLSKSHYEQVLARHPDFPFRARLRLKLARVLYLLSDTSGAIRQLETLLGKDAPESETAQEAQKLLKAVRGA